MSYSQSFNYDEIYKLDGFDSCDKYLKYVYEDIRKETRKWRFFILCTQVMYAIYNM